MSATAPSFFVDVTNFTYSPGTTGSGTAIPLFAVKSVGVDRSETILKGMDNNKLRPVAVHTVGINDTVTVDCEDGAGLENLMSSTGPGTVSFNWRAAAHNVFSGSQLADQTVTITDVVWDKKSLQQAMKGFGSVKFSGFVMENPGGDTVDPISFTTTSSPPSDAAN